VKATHPTTTPRKGQLLTQHTGLPPRVTGTKPAARTPGSRPGKPGKR